VPEDQVTSAQRRNAKTVNFGVIYGLSAFGLAKRLGMTQDEAAAFIDAYFARYPGVLVFQEKLLDDARRNRYVTTILGRRRSIEGIRPQSSYRQRNQAGRDALNTVIQGSAADLIKQAMLRIHRRRAHDGLAARMLLQIHDELLFEIPAAEQAPRQPRGPRRRRGYEPLVLDLALRGLLEGRCRVEFHVAGPDRPDDARELVRKGDGGLVVPASRLHDERPLLQPRQRLPSRRRAVRREHAPVPFAPPERG
jgi:hypothetical protein